MRFRLSKPTPAFVVAVTALFVALGGTSYAVTQIGSADIKDNSVLSRDVKDGTIRSTDIKNGSVYSADIADGSLLRRDFRKGVLPRGAKGAKGATGDQGAQGPQGPQGAQGPAGAGRWVLVNADGTIAAQSGGFSIVTAYDLINNSGAAVPTGALGNVYINANEPLTNNGVFSSIALQNAVDQNGDSISNGRAAGSDANPEFSGEITSTMCGIAGVVACAPSGANNVNHFVVSPRLSDGSLTDGTNHKRFYVIITGDSSDYVAPAA